DVVEDLWLLQPERHTGNIEGAREQGRAAISGMENQPRRWQSPAPHLRQAFGAPEDGQRSVADFVIGKECHLSLRVARHESKLDGIRGLVIAMSEPAAVLDDRSNDGCFCYHV